MRHTQPSPLAPTRSILGRMIMQALMLTGFIIIVLTTLSLILSRMLFERAIQTQLSSVAAIAENGIADTVNAYRERASLIAGTFEAKQIVRRKASPQAIARLLTSLQREQSSIAGIELYDARDAYLAGAGEPIGFVAPTNATRPVVTNKGVIYYDVFTPVRENGVKIGAVALRFDMQSAFAPLLAVTPSLGSSAQSILVWHTAKAVTVLHPSSTLALSYTSEIPAEKAQLMFRVLDGKEGAERADDYRGRDSLIAYRYLPSLDWGLLVQLDRKAALHDVRTLAIAFASFGVLLLILAGILSSMLAKSVTHPLRILTRHVQRLRPGNWSIHRSVHTGDEVELLDQVVVDMAQRLRKIYEKQEDIIDERTSELKKQYVLDSAILANVGFGVVTVDRNGVISGVNPAGLALLSAKREELVGRTIAKAIPICGHRGNPVAEQHPAVACLRTRRSMRSPVSEHSNIRLSNDALLPVAYSVAPLLSGGKIFGAIFVFHDTTEERRLDYLKSEFISLASHQMRSPLSSLRWYVELIADDKKNLDTQQRGYLKEIQTSITRMVSLLDSLLHAAHIEGNTIAISIQDVDIAGVIHELEQDCRSLIHGTDLQCAVVAPRKKLVIKTDPTLIRIVLQNLMSNAVKYSPDGAKRLIKLSLEETPKSVILSVKDTGLGIPKSDQDRIFEKFFRAKNIRTLQADGNGLGLYITRTIVDCLNGSIKFTSEENKGTTFTVTLPKILKQKKGKK